ncbi:MAG: type IV pilin [Thermoplasmata archaeon]|nr:type IV pilin [Thermoplasmata archaeon]
MNMWTKSQRRWRKKSKRGVSPIIATILLVAITVVLAAVLYILISGLTKGPGNTPLGTSLALQTPGEASKGAGATTNNWYNFSVQAAGGGLILNNLQFQVQTPSGQIVAAGGSWTLNVLGITGTVVGTYAFATNSWSAGGTVLMTSQQLVALNAVGATGLSGDTLIVIGTGSFQGSISVAIP